MYRSVRLAQMPIAISPVLKGEATKRIVNQQQTAQTYMKVDRAVRESCS
jgi:hypothetical protein